MRKNLNLRKVLIIGVLLAFLGNMLGPLPPVYAQDPAFGGAGGFLLPSPGQMVALSPAYSPVVLKGIQLDPKNPFRFHFFVDTGDDASLRAPQGRSNLKQESAKLIKYFLASLTIPEKDLWVNLSPYEKDRIVPQEFGQTEMGRDLLAQDYLLKQITASLIYPESQLGKAFWAKVYAQAQAKYGTTNIPINTFNKVWIVPEKAVVYENGGVAFVLENHLKVMLEEDYISLQKHNVGAQLIAPTKQGLINQTPADVNKIGSQIIRQIVIPALTKEVNTGKNFAQLRQVFYSLILATWYKKKIKDSILNKVYSNRNKISGVNVSVQDKDKIYQEYLKAFKKGVYNYIKEEPDPMTNEVIPRKYFSGGVDSEEIDTALIVVDRKTADHALITELSQKPQSLMDVDGDTAMITPNQPTDGVINAEENTAKQELIKSRIENYVFDEKIGDDGAYFVVYGVEGHPEMPVIKILRNPGTDTQDLMEHVQSSAYSMGGLIAPFVLLHNVNISIKKADGDIQRHAFPVVIVQQRLKPIIYFDDSDFRSRAESIIKQLIDRHFDYGDSFGHRNFGLTEDGKLLLVDIGGSYKKGEYFPVPLPDVPDFNLAASSLNNPISGKPKVDGMMKEEKDESMMATKEEIIQREIPAALYALKQILALRNHMDAQGNKDVPLIIWQNLTLGNLYPFFNERLKKALGIQEISRKDVINNTQAKLSRLVLVKAKFGSDPAVREEEQYEFVDKLKEFVKDNKAALVMVDHSGKIKSLAQEDVSIILYRAQIIMHRIGLSFDWERISPNDRWFFINAGLWDQGQLEGRSRAKLSLLDNKYELLGWRWGVKEEPWNTSDGEVFREEFSKALEQEILKSSNVDFEYLKRALKASTDEAMTAAEMRLNNWDLQRDPLEGIDAKGAIHFEEKLMEVDKERLPRFLRVDLAQEDEDYLKRVFNAGELSPDAREFLKDYRNNILTPKVYAELNAFIRGAGDLFNHRGHHQPLILGDGNNILDNLNYDDYVPILATFYEWQIWRLAGLDPESGVGAKLSKIYPSVRFRGLNTVGKEDLKDYKDIKKFIESLRKSPELMDAFRKILAIYPKVLFIDYQYRANLDSIRGGMGDQHEDQEIVPWQVFQEGLLEEEKNFHQLTDDARFAFYGMNQFYPARMIRKEETQQTPQERVDSVFDPYSDIQWKQWHVNLIYSALSAAKSQGNSQADEIWERFKYKLKEKLKSEQRPTDGAMKVQEAQGKALELSLSKDADDIAAVDLLQRLKLEEKHHILSIGPGRNIAHVVFSVLRGTQVDVAGPKQEYFDEIKRVKALDGEIGNELERNTHDRDLKDIPPSTYEVVLMLHALDAVSADEAKTICREIIRVLKNRDFIILERTSRSINNGVDIISKILQENGSSQVVKKQGNLVALQIIRHQDMASEIAQRLSAAGITKEQLDKFIGVSYGTSIPPVDTEGIKIFDKIHAIINEKGLDTRYRQDIEDKKVLAILNSVAPMLDKPREQVDGAMKAQKQNEGGIDLNPVQMSMQVKKEGEDFKFDFNGTEIDVAQVTGATFTIRTMTPVTNLPEILGLSR